MHKSFLRVQDWAPITGTGINNPCWLEILRIIDEFEQLVDTEKKQIIECIKQLTSRRIQLIKHFNKYKNSLNYKGEVKKENLAIFDSDKAKYFFSGYYGHVQQIMCKIGTSPRLFARMLAESHHKKFDSLDFVQSILYHLYPCYMPFAIKSYSPNNCLLFIQEIINRWSYDIRLGRPHTYTVIDQIINGLNKTPQIVCYVQKISMSFMKQLNKCKMQFFAFDQQAIRHQFELKRSMALSHNSQTKNWRSKLRSFFHKKSQEDNTQSFYSVASQASNPSDLEVDVNDIMRVRQRQFFNVVMKTIQIILNLQTPFLLNQMMRFFHNKIKRQMEEQKNKLNKLSLPQSLNSLNGQQEQGKTKSSSKATRHNSQSETSERKQYYRHYCYFLMTNLICQELTNKFTISHEEQMKPADLQNISQITKIITQVFQGHLPQGDKYKNERLQNLDAYLPKINVFYDKILIKSQCQIEEAQQKPKLNCEDTTRQGERIRQILLKLHQNTLILSFNDIRTILNIIKPSSYLKQLQLSPKSEKMQFLVDPKISNLFAPTTKRVQFHEQKHEVQKIFFVFNSHKPSNKQVIEFYIGSESPLKDLPMLTKSLMYGSNLNVTEALQVTKSLHLMQSLSLKQVKYFLNKIAARYNNLYLKDSEVLSDKFRQTIQLNLKRNINRKSVLLLHRNQICSRITSTEKLIEFYTQQLRSSQFYDRISQKFIHNIKIKAYLRIQNDELKIYQNVNQMKGVHLQSLLVTDAESKSKKLSEQYILRNSFKAFTTIPQLMNALVRSNITKSALTAGRRVDQFNQMFEKLCSIVVSYIQEFMKKRQILQNLNNQKLAKIIVSKIQNYIYQKVKITVPGILKQDKSLIQAKKTIDQKLFFKKDLEQQNIDWDFLFQQGKQKFNLMIQQVSIMERIRHFQQMFRMVFTVLGFSMAKSKISAEIINPVIQYLILVSTVTKHYQCLFSLKTLKWKTSSETSYNIVLYESSLKYIVESMSKDYPLEQVPIEQITQNAKKT